ncbi:MAG: DUF3810 domain-containing protein [Clostridia bacterium]|nr:DUF3810 domain-containing protein [Clostridia bacterium]MBQ8859652.1 DUF3810 domain-containing protein [Clostridia bacterium]
MIEETKAKSTLEKEEKAPSAVGRFFGRLSDGIYAVVPAPCYVLFLIGLLAAIVHVAACVLPGFADTFNQTVGAVVRLVLAKVTDVFPFSLAETLLLSLPVILALLIWSGVRRSSDKRRFWRFFVALLAVLVLFYSLFVFTIGCAYRGATLDKKMGITRMDITYSELYSTAEHMLQNTNEAAENVLQKDAESATYMGHTIAEMNELLLDAYDTVCAEYSFIQNIRTRVKPVAASLLMSYTHITGVYTYMTGEANINIDFPDYTIPYTAAHELAHQRGIAREDEANFVAYLVCIASEDDYIRYSGYMNMFEYLANALYSASPEGYAELMKQASPKVKAELRAYSEFYDQYRDSVAGSISGTINDAYLQMQGTPGTRSYGMVVDLAVAYYRYRI